MSAEQQTLELPTDADACPVCGGELSRLVVVPDRRICVASFVHLVLDDGRVWGDGAWRHDLWDAWR